MTHLQQNDWLLIENGFQQAQNKATEGAMWLGNGRFGHRAVFEERFSGDSLAGHFVAGIFSPEKMEVELLDAPNWLGLEIQVDGETLDLHRCKIAEFSRALSLREGTLERSCKATLKSGKMLKISAKRFCSLADPETGAIRFAITPVNFSGQIVINAFVEALQPEVGWVEIENGVDNDMAWLVAQSSKNELPMAAAVRTTIYQDSEEAEFEPRPVQSKNHAGCSFSMTCEQWQETVVYKYVGLAATENGSKYSGLATLAKRAANRAYKKGFRKMLDAQRQAWEKRWLWADFLLENDPESQANLRRQIFHLLQSASDSGLPSPEIFIPENSICRAWQQLIDNFQQR